MPSQTIYFDEDEDMMIELFKAANRMKNKKEAIRQMVRIAYVKEKNKIKKSTDIKYSI